MNERAGTGCPTNSHAAWFLAVREHVRARVVLWAGSDSLQVAVSVAASAGTNWATACNKSARARAGKRRALSIMASAGDRATTGDNGMGARAGKHSPNSSCRISTSLALRESVQICVECLSRAGSKSVPTLKCSRQILWKAWARLIWWLTDGRWHRKQVTAKILWHKPAALYPSKEI